MPMPATSKRDDADDECACLDTGGHLIELTNRALGIEVLKVIVLRRDARRGRDATPARVSAIASAINFR